MELRRHSNNHVIVVGVEVTTLRHIKSERRRIVVTSQQVVRVVHDTGRVHGHLGQLWGPHTHVCSLSLMDSLVWRPDSVRDQSLSVVPFLEEIGSVLLMRRVNSRQKFHGLGKLHLFETLVNKEIIFLMHGSVTSLAGSGEDLVSASQSCGVVGVPCDVMGPVGVSVVHSDGVNLFFVTLHTVGCSNVISEDPSFGRGLSVEEVVGSSSIEEAVDLCQVSVNRVILDALGVRGSHLFLIHSFEES